MSDSPAATTTTLRRHSSIPPTFQTSTQTLSLSHSLLNLKLDSLNHSPPLSTTSYTSLRDMLPPTAAAAINSPTATSSGYEIPIRNHLVKQAAWAYLQPMSASPTSSSSSSAVPHFLRRLCRRFFTFVKHHLIPALSQVFRRIFNAIGAN
ncbi:hypothetical protein RIF29_39673 [Crotalaria pallida]|uniref:Uncharacterized protein n=1 Tax=Crotalaria pallida TaxID=3830 RepID=A0AAN9HMP9_CROPI